MLLNNNYLYLVMNSITFHVCSKCTPKNTKQLVELLFCIYRARDNVECHGLGVCGGRFVLEICIGVLYDDCSAEDSPIAWYRGLTNELSKMSTVQGKSGLGTLEERPNINLQLESRNILVVLRGRIELF